MKYLKILNPPLSSDARSVVCRLGAAWRDGMACCPDSVDVQSVSDALAHRGFVFQEVTDPVLRELTEGEMRGVINSVARLLRPRY